MTKHTAGGPGAAQTAVQVPMLDLRRQYARIRDEIASALARVLPTQQFVGGPEVEAFEREAAAYLGTAEVIACASGTDALWLAMIAAGVHPGDAVLTTPFSFFATASAVVRCGARPIFVDIDPETFNMDARLVERRLTNSSSLNLRAIEPVHLYGQCADMDALAPLAAEHKLPLLEDAAQAFGGAWRGRRAGSLGRAAGFSFYPTKNLSAFGDAGCISTSDGEFAACVRRLRNHGTRERYYHEEVGWNSRLDALQAAVLRVKLKHIDQWNRERNQRAETYDRLFAAAGLAAKAGSPAPIVLPHRVTQAYHIFHQYVVRANRRDDLREFLKTRSVGTEIYYPVPLHLQRALRYLGHQEGDFPEAERASREVLALPMFPELTEDEQKYVVDSIADFYS